MNRATLSLLLVVLGLLVASAGFALWWAPAGLVVLGAGLAAVGLLLVKVDGGQRGR